ncbi:hypothetical protein ACJW30_09G078700 [Castanea mollissima]
MRIPLFSRLLPIPICSLTLIFAVSGQCLGDLRSYLLEFKNSLMFNSALSTKLVRWNQSVDCCSWEGVTCSEGRVVGLYLDNESIYGGLYKSILFRLHYLQHLSLAHNDFFPSCILPEFGNLTNLSYLNLSYAGFGGHIPIEISRLTSLVTLDLSFPSFEYCFDYELKHDNLNFATLVQNLTRLTELYLDEVIISSQGNEWCQALSSSLPNLRVLSMSDFPTLQTVDLSDNELLQGSLPEFYPNGSLQSLLLSGKQFSGTLPDSIGNLKRLFEIDLSRCNFNGSVPSTMANLTQLVYLDLSSNNFTGPIPSFSMAKNLTMIISQLQSLVQLYLQDNSLEWSIPASLFSLPSLRKLNLGNNNFSGQLHEFSNQLLGRPIPMSIFELQGLRSLTLSSNSFNGSLQLNLIQQLRNLTHLDLSNNNLLIEYNGTNSSLSSFIQIGTLKLASNKLKTFPEFLRHQANLRHLDLSDNQIHGKIPNWFWELPTLYIVNLSCNYLEGPLDNLHSIGFLDLHSNQLKGQLPIPLPFFHYLDLSRNNFNSVLPELDMPRVAQIGTFLSLSSNKFHGQIPKSICNGTAFRVLDLSNNSINGTIPDCFYSLSSSLRVLNLRKNNLTGKLSDIFPSNCSLQTLNVNKNLLEGVVPKSLANCRNLEVLDIGNNQIHDAMMVDNEAPSELNYLRFEESSFLFLRFEIPLFINDYYLEVITITIKGQVIELVKILTIFTSIDLSCNNFEGPIPEEIGVLKSLHILNLSHNAFRPNPTISGKINGEIPMQLADNLTFLSILNLSFNQLVGPIPYIKQFATFSETSYEGNKGLCGSPLKTCTSPKPSSPPPTFQDSNSNSRPSIDWNFLSVELGFVFGFGMVIWPITFCKRWRIRYCKHADDILFRIFPQLYLGGKQYRGIRAHGNAGRRH